jgi:hypothetical protein
MTNASYIGRPSSPYLCSRRVPRIVFVQHTAQNEGATHQGGRPWLLRTVFFLAWNEGVAGPMRLRRPSSLAKGVSKPKRGSSLVLTVDCGDFGGDGLMDMRRSVTVH